MFAPAGYGMNLFFFFLIVEARRSREFFDSFM
jgi:hypothetical protein